MARAGTITIRGADGVLIQASMAPLAGASELLADFLEGENLKEDSAEVLDMSDATEAQIQAFVAMCGMLSKGDDRERFTTSLVAGKSMSIVAAAIPLIHKYEARGLWFDADGHFGR